jgi:hypothetical protein
MSKPSDDLFGVKIICTALYFQGLMPESIYQLDQEYGRILMKEDPYVMKGYHLWARPIAHKILDSESFAKIVKPFAMPWAIEIAYRAGQLEQGHWWGKVLLDVGVPISRLVGKTAELYEDNEVCLNKCEVMEL